MNLRRSSRSTSGPFHQGAVYSKTPFMYIIAGNCEKYLEVRSCVTFRGSVGMWNKEPQQICSPDVVSPSRRLSVTLRTTSSVRKFQKKAFLGNSRNSFSLVCLHIQCEQVLLCTCVHMYHHIVNQRVSFP